MPKKIAKAEKDPNEIRLCEVEHVVGVEKGMPHDMQTAKTIINPVVQAANARKHIDKNLAEVDLTCLISALSEVTEEVSRRNLKHAEAMLTAQATVLDAIFNSLIMRSARNMGEGYMEATETYMRMALRAQAQCRSTWEAVSDIQNPPLAGYVRQANIAHGPQQINNGPVPEAATSRTGDKENPQNKLLEEKDGQRLDAGTTGTTGRTDQYMATVGSVDRAND